MKKKESCVDCNANPAVCQYCIYGKSKNCKKGKKESNDNIINYNNGKYDGKSKKICPVCKKVYTGYPATSRKDNKTLICTECGMREVQEPFEELLYEYGFEID